jgi:transcriptional regulator with XRE-family HTH domain
MRSQSSNPPASKPPRPARNPLAEAIGAEIKKLREGRGWSQLDLARALGSDPSKVSKYERGQHLPPHELLLRLAGVFGISLDRLMGRGPDEPEPRGLLAQRLVAVERLGPGATEAAAGLMDMLLALYSIFPGRPHSFSSLMNPVVVYDDHFATVMGALAGLEKRYRDVALTILEAMLNLLYRIRDEAARPTP